MKQKVLINEVLPATKSPKLTAQLMCPPDKGPKICANTKIPKPNDAATIIRLGFGKFKVTIAQPQHSKTKRFMAMNSARHALRNLLSTSSQMMKLFPLNSRTVGMFLGAILTAQLMESAGPNTTNPPTILGGY